MVHFRINRLRDDFFLLEAKQRLLALKTVFALMSTQSPKYSLVFRIGTHKSASFRRTDGAWPANDENKPMHSLNCGQETLSGSVLKNAAGPRNTIERASLPRLPRGRKIGNASTWSQTRAQS
jgi:hypothetical protein